MIESNSNYVCAILVDIKGAFDSLWWPEIARNLQRVNVNKTVYNTLISYLSDRSISLAHDGKTITREMNMGCPQGSVLGPLLCNIAFDSLLIKQLPELVKPIAFADDIAYNKGNAVLDTLEEWASRTKMKISVEKTQGIVLKGNMRARPPVFKFEDTRIKMVKQFKYLGIILDEGLTFLPHVKTQGVKARNMFGKVARIHKVQYGVKQTQLNLLYRTVFLPIISYASIAWSHRLTNYAIVKILKETQRQVLINTTGAYRTSPLLALCILTNNPPNVFKLREMNALRMRALGRIATPITDIKLFS